MWKRIGLVSAWLLATALSVAIATAAVGGVRDGVTDRPSALPSLTLASGAPTSTSAGSVVPTSGDQPADPSPTSSPTSGVPTTAPAATTGAPTTTHSPATTSPPATTAATPTTTAAPPPATTTTTSAPAGYQYETRELVGGWVRLAYRPGEVRLDGAGAQPGYIVDVNESGPSEVDVRFRSEHHVSELKADFEEGQLHVEVHESSGGDD